MKCAIFIRINKVFINLRTSFFLVGAKSLISVMVAALFSALQCVLLIKTLDSVLLRTVSEKFLHVIVCGYWLKSFFVILEDFAVRVSKGRNMSVKTLMKELQSLKIISYW